MPDQDDTPRTYYLLVCLECADDQGALELPFDTAQARGQWAADHTEGTGHNRWRVEDEQR